MKKQFLRGLIFGALATMGTGVSTLAQADGTASLDLTVEANITAGTCAASVVDGETATNTIGFGNVYISEVFAKTKVKPFKLRFSECAGLKDKTATVVLDHAASGGGCAGGNGQNAEFANMSSSESKAGKVAVEVWTTETPAGTNSVQLHCYNKNAQTVDLSAATSTTPVDFPLSARMAPVTGSALNTLTAGDFYSPTTFTITYQ